MNNAEALRLKMKELLNAGGTLTVPGAYDPVSARLIEQAGFPAVYIGSYATSAATPTRPDFLARMKRRRGQISFCITGSLCTQPTPEFVRL
jgi:2-methylisocitrate lyase-like PEP mutase family enzyme